jgi:PAS domain S-box-containing protein
MNDDRISGNWLFDRVGQTAVHGKGGGRDAIPVDEGVGIVDDAGNLVYASPVFARLHGYEPGEMTGLGLKRIFQPHDSTDMARLLEGVRGDSFATFMATHLRRDGSSFPASVNLIKMPGEGKWSGFYVCIVRAEAEEIDSSHPDVVEAAGGEASFEGLFQRSLTGIYRTTLEGEILLANPQFAKIFGYESPSELLRINARDLHPDESARKDFVRLITRLDRLENYRDVGRCKDDNSIIVI